MTGIKMLHAIEYNTNIATRTRLKYKRWTTTL